MHNRGTIVAVDRLASRLQLVTENCRRLGVNTVMPLWWGSACVDPRRDAIGSGRSAGAMSESALSRPFDRILLDAPAADWSVTASS